MSEKKAKAVCMLNIVCAALMIVMIVLQFTPFWHFTDGETEKAVSVNGYVWMPDDNKALTKHLQETLDPEFKVDQIIGAPILQLASGAVGAVLCLIWANKPVVSLLPVVCGAAGLYGYFSKAALQLGSGWALHAVVSAVILLAGIAALFMALKKEG